GLCRIGPCLQAVEEVFGAHGGERTTRWQAVASPAAMDIEVSAAEPGDLEVDVLGVPVTDPPDASRFDERIRPRLEGISELSGETGSTVVVHLNGEVPAARVAAVGVGSSPDADSIRTAAAAVARAASRIGGTVGWAIDPGLGVPADVQARAAVEGIAYGAYRPGRWKSKESARE